MAGNKTADELLKWSLRQESDQGPSTAQISEEIAQGKRPDLSDPKLYDALMGKSEAQMMQEELAAALDDKREEEDRCTALDNFEMLIESIDNANNMTNMKMWSPLLSLLTSSSTNTPPIQTATLWIIGTAIQNNPKAQSDLLSQSPEPISLILNRLKSQDGGVRSKAMYALSAMLKLHGKALVKFEGMGGWEILKQALKDPAINLRRKTAFLLSTLLIQDDSVPSSDSTFTTNPAPVGLLGSAPQNSNSSNTHLNTTSTTSTTNLGSRATAVAPTSASNSSNDGPGSAPLEIDPTSLLSDSASPNISEAILTSGILRILILSILPIANEERDLENDFSMAGLDGDLDPAEDLDYSEKSLNAIVIFVKKFQDFKSLDENLKKLLKDLSSYMSKKGDEDIRWKELGLENHDWKEFEEKLKNEGISV